MSLKNLESLETWCKARDFSLRVYRELIPHLPAEEKYALCQQLRRSAVSIPANIAEGHGRFYYQDNVRFCYNARGSLEETLSHICICFQLQYIPEDLYNDFVQEGEQLSLLLNGYINYLKRSKRGANEPGSHLAIHDNGDFYIVEPAISEQITTHE